MKTLAALALVTLPWLAAAPQTTEGPHVGELDWLAGHWASEQGGLAMEEVWTAPRGGMLLGLHRDVHVESDCTVSFEFLRIVRSEEGLTFLASPGGREPTPFALVELEPGHVAFANEAHDFPKRIAYTLEDDGGTLHAQAEGGDGKALEWRWKRVE